MKPLGPTGDDMTDQLSRSAEESDGVDPTWVRLEDQLGWRTSSAGTTTRVLPPSRHTRGSSSLSSSSAPRPVVAGLQAPAAVTAFLSLPRRRRRRRRHPEAVPWPPGSCHERTTSHLSLTPSRITPADRRGARLRIPRGPVVAQEDVGHGAAAWSTVSRHPNRHIEGHPFVIEITEVM